MKASTTRLSFAGLLGISCFFFSRDCYALDPTKGLSQYSRRVWAAGSGLPAGAMSAIAQSSDGYLWIGTEQGLLRFDGRSFTLLRNGGANSLSLENVLGLATDPEGGLWIRLPEPTLLRYAGGAFSEIRVNSEHDPLVTVVGAGPKQSLLFASRLNGVFTWKDNRLQTIRPRASLPVSPVLSISGRGNGEVWLGTLDSGLLRLHGNAVEPVTAGLPSPKINCLLTTAEDQLYVGTDRGLVRWDGAALTTVGIPPSLRGIPILAMTRDRDENVWIGSSQGLLRWNPQGTSSFSDIDSAKPVTALFEDREGDLWAAGGGQLMRLSESAFSMHGSAAPSQTVYSGPVHADSQGGVWTAPSSGGLVSPSGEDLGALNPPGLPHDEVYSITGDSGDLWLGTKRSGLIQLTHRGSRTYTPVETSPHASIYAVHKNRDGTIWAGTLTAGASHLENGQFRNYTMADGLASNTVLSIAEGADGTMWFGTPSGLSSYSQNRWRNFGVQDGLPSANISTLLQDDSGILWLGTLRGIAFVRAGRVVGPAQIPRSLLDPIFGITQDRLGSLWIVSASGVLRVDRAKLLAASLSYDDVREFGASDGLLDLVGVRRERSIVTDSTGRVWLSRREGLGVLDPSRLHRTAVPTLVHIVSLAVDGQSQKLSSSLVLPPNPRRIVIEYAGLNLSAPDQVRYRFRLDGFDPDWNTPAAGQEVAYTNLNPGPYRFHVVASNADQVWNGAEAELSFEVAPALWQTKSLQAAFAGLILLIVLSIYRLRLRQVTEQVNAQFEGRLAERTRIARELHDTLLQSFQGLILRFQAAQNLLPEQPLQARDSLMISIERAALAITEGRDAVQNLRSGEAGVNDLVTSLTALGDELGSSVHGLATPLYRVLVEGKPRRLHPALQEDLYRICREAVANAFRHAQASHVELDIRYAPRLLRLRVRDDGVGMDPKILSEGGRAGHWGLPGMQERARAIRAKFEIWSQLARGTEIELTVPGNIAYSEPRSRFSSFLHNLTKQTR